LCVLSVKLRACAKWNKTGITVASDSHRHNFTVQVDSPQSIFIHSQTNRLYVADSCSKHILMIALDQQPIKGTIVVSLDTDPDQIYVDDDKGRSAIYVTLPSVKRVEKWIQETSSSIQMGEKCDGVSVDNEKNVYMTSFLRNCVFKWSPQTNTTTIVAGQIDKAGVTGQFLYGPVGIHVDRITSSVYVADFKNHRIQKWAKNAEEGVTIAGVKSGLPGRHPAALKNPYGVLVDDETHIVYVADQRWLPNASEGDTIVGDLCMYLILSSSSGCKKNKR
jgi:DNA-binding beta-propeller fold protein YncE